MTTPQTPSSQPHRVESPTEALLADPYALSTQIDNLEHEPTVYVPLPSSSPRSAIDDENVKTAWLAELQRRPWYRRPSIFWMMPFLFVLNIATGIQRGPMEQLVIQIICKDYLSDAQDHSGTASKAALSFISSSAGRVMMGDENPCQSPAVLAFAALVRGRVRAVAGTLTLLTLAKWTTLSDQFGRKALIRLPLATACISLLFTCFIASSHNPFGYRLLYVEAVFLGITAGSALFNPAVFAYTADCTSSASRSVAISYISGSSALGGILGPPLGGYIVKITGDLILPIQISIICLCLMFAFLFVMPESLPESLSNTKHDDNDRVTSSLSSAMAENEEENEQADGFMAVPVGPIKKQSSLCVALYDWARAGLLSMLDPLLLFVPGAMSRSRKMPSRYILALFLGVVFLNQFVFFGILTLFIPMTNLLFKWTAYEDGLFFSFSDFCSFGVFVGVLPLLQYLYKRYISNFEQENDEQPDPEREPLLAHSDAEQRSSLCDAETRDTRGAPVKDNAIESLKMESSFLLSGLVLFAVSCLIIPIFKTVPALIVAEAIAQVRGISGVAWSSMLTTLVPSHQTGKALGALSVADQIAHTLAYLVYGQIFAKTSATMPLFYYYVSAGLAMLAALFAFGVWTLYHKRVL